VLRKGVTCSDGTPLTATTVADNINFVGDVKNASSRVGVFVPPGATAKGDDTAGTVTVTSPAPSSFLVRTVGSLSIVCDKGMKDRSTLKEGADGTGMFTLTEAVPGDHYTLTRRTDYAWGPGDWQTTQHGLPDKVVIKIVTNETTAANLLTTNQANAAQIVGPDRQRMAALKLFELGRLSSGKAAELAQLSRTDFLEACGRYHIAAFNYPPGDTEAELQADLEVLRELPS